MSAKLTHEAYGDEQTISFNADSDIHDYMDYVQRLLIAASFSPETVREGFIEKAEELRQDEKDIHTE